VASPNEEFSLYYAERSLWRKWPTYVYIKHNCILA
jgi:hypothetical protein